MASSINGMGQYVISGAAAPISAELPKPGSAVPAEDVKVTLSGQGSVEAPPVYSRPVQQKEPGLHRILAKMAAAIPDAELAQLPAADMLAIGKALQDAIRTGRLKP